MTDFERLSSELILFDQEELSDNLGFEFIKRIGSFNLSFKTAGKNLLKGCTKVTFYRNIDAEFASSSIKSTNLYIVIMSEEFCSVLVFRTMMQIHEDYN